LKLFYNILIILFRKKIEGSKNPKYLNFLIFSLYSMTLFIYMSFHFLTLHLISFLNLTSLLIFFLSLTLSFLIWYYCCHLNIWLLFWPLSKSKFVLSFYIVHYLICVSLFRDLERYIEELEFVFVFTPFECINNR